ncbi:MAG: LysM peptidoglycan-binding domain-containing protein [Anaerolineales bacterium]|nr:LysM peptidoglycan-binding domain-containing protein [Anaerolineales bacterium]
MSKRNLILLFLLSSFIFPFHPVQAQDAAGPIYIVQPGDSLSSIASRFSVSLADLMSFNNITDANQLDAGQQLVIPGLEGITGILSTEVINFGDSFHSLMRRTQIPEDLFKKLNHVVSPSEFYVGASMIIPVEEGSQNLTTRISPGAGESLLELAVKQNTNVWSLAHYNNLQGSWDGLPGDTLFTSGGNGEQITSGLPSAFVSAEIRDLPIKQGGTGVIMVKTIPNVTLGGILVDHSLHFFPTEDGTQVAFQGVHALLEPGVYPLRLDATLPDGSVQSYEQMILIVSGYYADITLSVPSETLDPSVTEPENQQIISVVSTATTTKNWQQEFNIPVALPFCIKDWFGIRRTYLGQGTDIKLNGFHSGVDYGVCSESNPYDIYAPAPGTVVFTAPLTVRGNATIIDHGWGVYSGFWHQEESYVTVGQFVKTGELIGKIGSTGRVTGAHLHWDLWVNGVQVEPLDWLIQAYP